MKLQVHKFPDAFRLAECREVPDAAPAPSAPWVEMTVAEFESWRDSFVRSQSTQPAYNPDTHKVVSAGFVFDDGARTAVEQWSVVSLDAAELQEVNFKKLDNWIATFEANTATAAQTQTAMARVLRELKRLRGTS